MKFVEEGVGGKRKNGSRVNGRMGRRTWDWGERESVKQEREKNESATFRLSRN